jgi:DAK2 domain fusion protein YloV
VLDCLDATAVRRWCAAGLDALRRHQAEIDQLNVYPVPDGDTGTNLVLTVTSAWEALVAEPDLLAAADESDAQRLARILRCMARGALLGARGNSGVIVSQILRGTADALADLPAGAALAKGRAVAGALSSAAKAAYGAVAEPVEGTVLTVVAAAAAGAHAADTDDLSAVVEAAARAATAALARTPEQLPVLARAGVVDAGGRGLVVLLDALAEVVTGRSMPAPASTRRSLVSTMLRERGSAAYEYEVQYLLDATTDAVESLTAALGGLGDSLVIVGAGGDSEITTWNVHVHVNDVGAAVEAGVDAGRPYRITVTRFADQMAVSAGTAVTAPPERVTEPDHRAVVVVTRGAGLAAILTAEGATVVDAGASVEGGETGSPSTFDLLDAIRATGAGEVMLLPNDTNVQGVANAAAAEARVEGIRVAVLPTRSPVQALAALAVRDASRQFDDEVIAMAEVVGACRFAEVTVATREALTVAGRCQPGDVLALVEGEVLLIGSDLSATCATLLDRMLDGGGEMVTLILGSGAPADLADSLGRYLADHRPFVEVQTYDGGQPHYPLLVGVE